MSGFYQRQAENCGDTGELCSGRDYSVQCYHPSDAPQKPSPQTGSRGKTDPSSGALSDIWD